MATFAIFLRGMNVGGRRIKNPDLIATFAALGHTHVRAFLASGNVVLESAEGEPEKVASHIEAGLQRELGYPVSTFLRQASALKAVGDAAPFSQEEVANSQGKVQVMFLQQTPSPEACEVVLALETTADCLRIVGRELYWLPEGGISDSKLNTRLIEKTIGPTTVRTQRTISRMIAKFFA